MKKRLMTSLVVASVLGSINVYAADSVATMFANGQVSGQIRMFSIDRKYEGALTEHRNATALGGHLKYETGSYEGLSFGTALYTTNRIASSPTIIAESSCCWTSANGPRPGLMRRPMPGSAPGCCVTSEWKRRS